MSRVFGIELRRSSAIAVGVIIMAVGVGVLLSFTEGFAGRWAQLAGGMRVSLFALWPLALAGGAWLGRREARARVGELFATTARPRWHRVLPPSLALALTVVAGYLAMLVGGIAFVAPSASHFNVGTVGLIAAGCVSMVTAAWLGLAAGRAMPWLATAPALAVLGVLVVGLLPDFLTIDSLLAGEGANPPAALMLSPVYSGGFDDFQAFASGPSLVQMLWFAAVAATGLLLFAASRPAFRALAVVPAVLGLVVTLPLLPTGGYEGALLPDRDALALVCDDAGPQVCLTKVHAGLLPDITGPAREALALIATKLPDAPTRAVESDWPTSYVRKGAMPDPRRYGADTLVFRAPSYGKTGRADFDGEPYLETLLAGPWDLHCGAGGGNEPVERDRYLAQHVATAWLLGRPFGEDPSLPSALERFMAKPLEEQRSLMAAARAGVVACDPDALTAILR
jgi:hypothetical protein